MKLASVEEIVEVKEHPNADSLDIVTVLGYQSIVPRGKHKKGDWVVYKNPGNVVESTDVLPRGITIFIGKDVSRHFNK